MHTPRNHNSFCSWMQTWFKNWLLPHIWVCLHFQVVSFNHLVDVSPDHLLWRLKDCSFSFPSAAQKTWTKHKVLSVGWRFKSAALTPPGWSEPFLYLNFKLKEVNKFKVSWHQETTSDEDSGKLQQAFVNQFQALVVCRFHRAEAAELSFKNDSCSSKTKRRGCSFTKIQSAANKTRAWVINLNSKSKKKKKKRKSSAQGELKARWTNGFSAEI